MILLPMLSILFSAALISSPTKAAPVQHGAHVHGVVNLNVAVEGKQVAISLMSPGESILGFEHQPKSDKDLAKVNQEKARWSKQWQSLFSFAAKLKCELANHSWQTHNPSKGHLEVEADLTFNCAAAPQGTSLTVKLAQAYPGMKIVKLAVIRGDGTVSQDSKETKSFTVAL